MMEQNQDQTNEVEQEENCPVEENTQEKDNTKKPSKAQRIRSAIFELLVYVAIIVVCVMVVPRYVIQRTIVDGTSMEATLQDQDNLLVDKLSYRFSDPKRFDVIVFYPYGRENEDYYIKRVIGLPGETVSIKDGFVYINGEKLDEDYLPVSGITQSEKTTFEVPAGHIFAMGDNRTGSLDSRYWNDPYIPLNQLQGRMLLAISIGPKQSWQGIHWIA